MICIAPTERYPSPRSRSRKPSRLLSPSSAVEHPGSSSSPTSVRSRDRPRATRQPQGRLLEADGSYPALMPQFPRTEPGSPRTRRLSSAVLSLVADSVSFKKWSDQQWHSLSPNSLKSARLSSNSGRVVAILAPFFIIINAGSTQNPGLAKGKARNG